MDQGRPHRLQRDMDRLQGTLLEMAGLVEESIAVSTLAVIERDPSRADELRVRDMRIDDLEMEIDDQVLELLALQQPLASDFRQIFTTNKIANDLERMGDHAVNLARAAQRMSQAPPLPEIRELTEMVSVTREMVADSLAAYVSRNPIGARVVCATDDRVDDLRSSMYRILVTHMLEQPHFISGALELLLVSQNLERIADLATNVAEDVVFLVEGRTIKHGTDLPADER